jgi:hypothetical protein
MKTLPAVTFLAALVGFVVLPLSFEVTASLLFAAGFGAIVFSDYTRVARSLRRPIPVPIHSPRKERFGLAA